MKNTIHSKFYIVSLGMVLSLSPMRSLSAAEVEVNLPEPPDALVIRGLTNAAQVTGSDARKRDAAATAKAASRRLRDRVAVLSDVTVPRNEVAKDVVVVGGQAVIEGTVEGSLVVVLGEARLGPQAEIKHNLVLVSSVVSAAPEARLPDQRTLVAGSAINASALSWTRWPQQWFRQGLLMGRPLPPQQPWAWATAALAVLLYALVVILFPRQSKAVLDTMETQPGRCYLIGLVGLLLMVPLLALLAATVVGVILIPFACVGLLGAFVLGKAAFYGHAGRSLGRQFGMDLLDRPPVALLAGAILFVALYAIPFAGGFVWLAILPMALGAPIRTVALAIAARSEQNRPTQATAGLVPPLVAESPQGLAQLPRAGFWIRLTATTLDALLVGMLCGLTHLGKWFVLVWAAYHIGLWAWRGTTVGGIICGLLIVRSSGRPLNFAAALVRSLASFFSFAVLCLGFFWVGWSREKQSWHDKIADTVVVRLPRSVPACAPAPAA
jgi:uncharacterized RDD family membrane protein YckC